MNKENKQLAKERRQHERELEQRKQKILAVIPIILIIAAACAAAVWFFLPGARNSGNSDSVTGQSTEAGARPDQTKSHTSAAGTSSDTADIARFDASLLKGCYDISNDDLTYVQINVKDYGTITAALDSTIAPVSVENFVSLAKDGFYDGLTFHRIIDGFMIQGGDPNGNGTGGSKKTIKGEFSQNGVENPITHVRGAFSMARSQDPDSASSQFFIVQSDSKYLDGQYAGFGYVTDGMDIVDKICKDAKPTDGNGSIAAADQPVIESVTIFE